MFKLEKLWVAPEWEQQLSTAGLLDIESVTTREFDWFETPNKRLGGWSGVSRLLLNRDAPEEAEAAVFLKIQENHCYRTIGNGFKKRLTFERELDAYEGLCDSSLLPELVLFAKWRKGKDVGSLMVTRELKGFVEFEDYMQTIRNELSAPESEIRRALLAVADATRVMHETGWAHFTHKPKHVFIRTASDSKFEVRFIDFERARCPFRKKIFVTEDLSRFLRHSHYLSRAQKLQFLLDYLQTDSFSSQQQRWVDQLEKDKSLLDGIQLHAKR